MSLSAYSLLSVLEKMHNWHFEGDKVFASTVTIYA